MKNSRAPARTLRSAAGAAKVAEGAGASLQKPMQLYEYNICHIICLYISYIHAVPSMEFPSLWWGQ